MSLIAFRLHIIREATAKRNPMETVTVNSHGNYNRFRATESSVLGSTPKEEGEEEEEEETTRGVDRFMQR
ncbi:hypothetical protein ANTRET_LOCUS2463 [Anthophora retusa]